MLEEERLHNEIRVAQATTTTTSARALRLQKQRDFLQQRALGMLRRGLKSLDELDVAKEKERKEQEEKEKSELEKRIAKASSAFPASSLVASNTALAELLAIVP